MRMFLDIFAQIFRNLWVHKLRSFLTMFGIAWGVGSLLLLVGLGEGFRSGNKRALSEFGHDIMFIFPGRAPVVQGNMSSARNYLLTYEDYLDIKREAPHVGNASPVLTRNDIRAVSEFATANGELMGVEPQYNGIRYLPLKQVRWLNGMDEAQKRNVIVLAQDEVHKLIARNHGFDYHDENAFDGWDSVQESKMIGTVFDAMDMFLGGVGLVTLALGAIGVINIMLVTVSERTHEIGLRKALGATNRNILFQFFLEGLLLTLGSGMIGMLFAAGLMALGGNVHGPGGFDPPKLVPMSAILAIGSLTLAGVVAGVYPARKAALLQPVEALRQE